VNVEVANLASGSAKPFEQSRSLARKPIVLWNLWEKRKHHELAFDAAR